MLDLLEKLERYLTGDMSIRDLEAWVVANLQRTLDSKDDAAIRLTNAVDAALVDLHEGIVDLETFDAALRELCSQASRPSVVVSAMTETVTIQMDEEWFSPVKTYHLAHAWR